MCFQSCLIQLFHLRVQTIIFKNTAGTVGQIFHIKMDKLGAQSHHLVDSFNKVIGHFIAKTQTILLMLIQCYGSLPSPCTFIFL